MRASLAAVFLYSRAIKLPLLPLMIQYFGTNYTLVLCLYLLGFSFVSGALMAKLEDRETA
jgi:phosphoenolpyruvate carboxylase